MSNILNKDRWAELCKQVVAIQINLKKNKNSEEKEKG